MKRTNFENTMRGTCSKHGQVELHRHFHSKILKGVVRWEDLGVDRRTVLKWVMETGYWNSGQIYLAQDRIH